MYSPTQTRWLRHSRRAGARLRTALPAAFLTAALAAGGHAVLAGPIALSEAAAARTVAPAASAATSPSQAEPAIVIDTLGPAAPVAVRPTVNVPAAPVRFVVRATPRPRTPVPPVPPVPPTVAAGYRSDPEISWYGPGFYGRAVACRDSAGRRIALTQTLVGVAHRSLPCGTLVTFRYHGHSVTVPVIDRGPYVTGRIFDLTSGACAALGHCFTGPIEYRLGG